MQYCGGDCKGSHSLLSISCKNHMVRPSHSGARQKKNHLCITKHATHAPAQSRKFVLRKVMQQLETPAQTGACVAFFWNAKGDCEECQCMAEMAIFTGSCHACREPSCQKSRRVQKPACLLSTTTRGSCSMWVSPKTCGTLCGQSSPGGLKRPISSSRPATALWLLACSLFLSQMIGNCMIVDGSELMVGLAALRACIHLDAGQCPVCLQGLTLHSICNLLSGGPQA